MMQISVSSHTPSSQKKYRAEIRILKDFYSLFSSFEGTYMHSIREIGEKKDQDPGSCIPETDELRIDFFSAIPFSISKISSHII